MAGRITYYGNIVKDGLVLNLDAGKLDSYPRTGTAWNDISGFQNNGKLENGPTFNSGNGGSIVFDGGDDYVNLGTIFNFTSENFSFSYWVNFNSLTTNQIGQGPIVLYKGSFNNNGYYDQISTNGTVGIITNQTFTIQVSSTASGTISINNWYNICYTRNGSSIRIYVNGEDRTQTAGTHINPQTSNNEFRIANYQNGLILGNFRLANFLTYNRALSSAEVLQNYNATKGRYL
jgi:hypothetical protein